MRENTPIAVSVVIPVKNGEAFVGGAIGSALPQLDSTGEVIVVDNGSTDRTLEVLARFGTAITVLREEQGGAARCRNRGVEAARGRYLAFLDADDLWTPGKLARQLAVLKEHPEVGLVFGHAQDFGDDATLEMRPDPYPWVSASALFCERETFLRIGDLPETSGGEFVAWYGWATTLGIVSHVLPDVLVKRRVHASNSTRNPSTKLGYIASAKWLLDRRRAHQEEGRNRSAEAGRL